MKIVCPENITTYAKNQTNQANVSWPQPLIEKKSNTSKITLNVTPTWATPPVMLNVSEEVYVIRYTVTDNLGNTDTCAFSLSVRPFGELVTCIWLV